MPELPEVETIKLGLQKYLVGHTIENIDVRLPRILSGKIDSVIGGKVEKIRRFGKGLVIDLDNGYSLAVHVKMTGQLIYVAHGPATREIGNLPDLHTHVVFHLDNGAVLYYRDMRQFGWVKIVKTSDVLDLPFFKALGPEPFKDLTFETFQQILAKKKTAIKQVLMDQALIAGIGNIYANDALFVAGVHPKRPAVSLTKEEQGKLFAAIETVLKKGLAAGGASEWHYVDVLGGKGKYQNFFQVYRRDGKPCSRCGTIIQKEQLGGRGTFYCPHCQV